MAISDSSPSSPSVRKTPNLAAGTLPRLKSVMKALKLVLIAKPRRGAATHTRRLAMLHPPPPLDSIILPRSRRPDESPLTCCPSAADAPPGCL